MIKTLQIIPAVNVVGIFDDGSGPEECPIICWALIELTDEDGTTQSVRGMVIEDGCSDLAEVDDVSGFLRYEYR